MAHLNYLSLWNFRNYSKATLPLSPKINLFIGQNGQGKTNCLEAITLLISGKSFRTSFLNELVLHGESFFSIQAHFIRHGIEQSLRLNYSPQKKQMQHNETVHSSFAPLIGLMQGVFFSGFQNQLIKGAPNLRRRFLDLQSAQIDPLYLHHLRRYQQALKERNVLLRARKERGLELYEELMSLSAPYLIEQRMSALEELERLAQVKHEELTGKKESFKIVYQMHPIFSKAPSSEEFLIALKRQRQKDLRMGVTSLGPHKDDLHFYLKDYEAKKYASEGQIQSLITSLYLSEYQRLLNKSNETPLFCVDDIGQNLDGERLHKLYHLLDQMGQVFITTPKMPDYSFKGPVQVFEIQNGEVRLSSQKKANLSSV